MKMTVSEAMAGKGENRVHINMLIGSNDGPVGVAFATALTGPRPGYIPFLVVLQPNIPVWPATLFINKEEIKGGLHCLLYTSPSPRD